MPYNQLIMARITSDYIRRQKERKRNANLAKPVFKSGFSKYPTIKIETTLLSGVITEKVVRYSMEYKTPDKEKRYCDICEEDTIQIVRYGGHERDSSNDYQECLTCGNYKLGLIGEWRRREEE